MKSISYRFGMLGLVTALLVGCQAQTNFSTDREPDGNNLGPQSDESLKGSHTLQTKTLYATVEAMSARTGIYPNTLNTVVSEAEDGRLESLRNYIGSNATSLPVQSDAGTVQAAHLLAVFNMAYEYCRVLVDLDSYRAPFFEGTAFEVIPSSGNTNGIRDTVLTGGNIQILVDTFLSQFWGARINPSAAYIGARADLIELAEELRPMVTDNSAGLRAVMHGTCASALSSAPTILQ